MPASPHQGGVPETGSLDSIDWSLRKSTRRHLPKCAELKIVASREGRRDNLLHQPSAARLLRTKLTFPHPQCCPSTFHRSRDFRSQAL